MSRAAGDAFDYLIEQNLEQSVENHNELISSLREEVTVINNNTDDSSPEEEVIVINNDVDDSEKTFKVEEIEEIINKKRSRG